MITFRSTTKIIACSLDKALKDLRASFETREIFLLVVFLGARFLSFTLRCSVYPGGPNPHHCDQLVTRHHKRVFSKRYSESCHFWKYQIERGRKLRLNKLCARLASGITCAYSCNNAQQPWMCFTCRPLKCPPSKVIAEL